MCLCLCLSEKQKEDKSEKKGKLILCNKTQREMRRGGHGRLGLQCVFICINITDTERCFLVASYSFGNMTCFCMSNDGMKSIYLFDEKSSIHFYNPGRHTECSDPVWDLPQMVCTRHVCILSLLVNTFAREESSWHVPQHGEVKQIQKRVYARQLPLYFN